MEKKLPTEIKLDVRDFLDETQLEKFCESLKDYLINVYPDERCYGFDISSITLSNMEWCEKKVTYQVGNGNDFVADFDTFDEAKACLEQNGCNEIIKETEYTDAKCNSYDYDYQRVYKKER